MSRLSLRLLVVLVTGLALAISGPAVEAMASGAPADAAKKKKKRSCAKKKRRSRRSASEAKRKKKAKCKKKARRRAGGQGPGGRPDPTAVAQAYVNGFQFYRPFASQYSSGEETWRFCDNGRFFYRYTTSGTYTTSEEYGNGTWRVEKGEYAESGGKQGLAGVIRLDGTVSGRTVNDQSQNNALKFVYAFANEQQAGLDAGNGFQEFQHTRATDTC